MCELENGTIATTLSLEEITEGVKGLGGHSHEDGAYCLPVPGGLSIAQVLRMKKEAVKFHARRVKTNGWRYLPSALKAVIEPYHGFIFLDYRAESKVVIEGDVAAVAGKTHEERHVFCENEQTRRQAQFLKLLPDRLMGAFSEANIPSHYITQSSQ